MNWVVKLFEDPQGLPDDARIASAVVVATFCGCAVYSIYKGQPWNPQEFGIGVGALFTGIGLLFGQRKGN